MAKRHPGLPRPNETKIYRSELLKQLQIVDNLQESRERVLSMENSFRHKIESHVSSLPEGDDQFHKFNTSPYVLLIHARQKNYTKVSEIESDILPAKQFSSMETSAGKMIEKVVLPIYGWSCVESKMHTTNSILDGKKEDRNITYLATLKSGPKCLNDEMSENFADTIIKHSGTWASESKVSKLDFTYGVLYGTKKISNKKDWHVLRNIKDKLQDGIIIDPCKRWDCSFNNDGIEISVNIRIGLDWWCHLGGKSCFIEVFAALIRACINPGPSDCAKYQYSISDLKDIVSTSVVREDFNVSLLQRSQIPWLFLMARHFCDQLID